MSAFQWKLLHFYLVSVSADSRMFGFVCSLTSILVSFQNTNFKHFYLFSDVNQSGEIDRKDFEMAVEVTNKT